MSFAEAAASALRIAEISSALWVADPQSPAVIVTMLIL
jgi:hypothetical protein